jgi:hypothetical protein
MNQGLWKGRSQLVSGHSSRGGTPASTRILLPECQQHCLLTVAFALFWRFPGRLSLASISENPECLAYLRSLVFHYESNEEYALYLLHMALLQPIHGWTRLVEQVRMCL